MREKYDRRRHAGERTAQGGAAPSVPESGHQAQGLDVDLLAVAVEIGEPAGPVLASLTRIWIAAVCRRGDHAPFSRQRPAAPGRGMMRSGGDHLRVLSMAMRRGGRKGWGLAGSCSGLRLVQLRPSFAAPGPYMLSQGEKIPCVGPAHPAPDGR